MPRKKGEITTGRFFIPYRIYGNAKPSLICVNGLQQTMAAWHPVVQRFSKEYEMIVFDLPGQGRARILSGPFAVSLDEQVAVLHQVSLAVCGQEPAHVVGASSGAVIAAAYAARYPRFVDKLILGSFGVQPTPLMLETIQEGERLFYQGRGHEIAHLIIDRFGRRISETNQKRVIAQFRDMVPETFRVLGAQCERIAKSRHIDEYVDLTKIEAATLIINGEEDAILNNADLQSLSSRIPHCEIKLIEGAGHFLHWEREDILDLYALYLRNGQKKASQSAGTSGRRLRTAT